MTDIMRKRLALFHLLNLDNSNLVLGIEIKRSSLDGLYTLLYTVLGVSRFLYSDPGSPEPNREYSTDRLTLSYVSYLKLTNWIHWAVYRIDI